MSDVKTVRVEIEYEDGKILSLHGDDAERWQQLMKGMAVLHFVHGGSWEQMPWKETGGSPMAKLTEIPDVRITRNTGKALLCVLDSGEGKEVWVPCSVVDDTSEINDAGDEGTLVVQKWFAEKTDDLADYVD